MSNNTANQPEHSEQLKPVKPFALEAWKIWNKLTDSAQSLWEEFEDDFVEFCLQEANLNTIQRRRYPF
ncbi:MAG TPA: hypothetical protein VHO70_03625 [Chitinispirillaceae bacterium]|nr:hypothetical protein [Chitinispirillaceae bacterium]